MEMEILRDIAVLSVIPLAIIGGFDAIYFHLYKHRLYKWPDTVREHLIHTLRTVLFPFTILIFFAANAAGPLLWVGIAIAAVDLGIQQWDLIEEKAARKRFEGLSTAEYSIHVWATGVHLVIIALALLAKPLSAFSLGAPMTIVETSSIASTITWLLVPGGFGIALLHIVLLHPRFRAAHDPVPVH